MDVPNLCDQHKAIALARGGSRKHVLAIPTTIEEICPHLRRVALEVLLIRCSKERHSLELAEALLTCIGNLIRDFRLGSHHHDESDLDHPSPEPIRSDHKALERLIIQHSNVVCGMLRLCSQKSSWFSKEGALIDMELDPIRLERRIIDTAACLQTLVMNKATSPVIFQDDEMLRVPVRFWLANVLASKHGEVNTIVHATLFYCGGLRHDDDCKLFKMAIEENGGDAYSVAALFVSELKAAARKDFSDSENLLSHERGLVALVYLNTMMAFQRNSIKSLHRTSLNLGIVSILTRAALQVSDEMGDRLYQSGYFSALRDILALPDGVQWAVEAIRAGLLTVIGSFGAFVSRGSRSSDDGNMRGLQEMIQTLTLYLVHYSVVRAAVRALSTMASELLEMMKDMPYFPAWKKFQSTLLERAVFMSQLARKITSSERMLHCEFVRDIYLCPRR